MGASTEGALIGLALGATYMMLPKLVEGASEAANSVVSAAKDKAGELFSAAIEGTRKGLTTAATWISESASSAAKTAREGATYVVESVKSGLSTVADVASKYADDVSTRAVNLYDSIKSSAVALVKTATAVPAGLLLRSREAVYSLWEGTKQTVRSWLWGILNVFNNSGPLDGSGRDGAGAGGSSGAGGGNGSSGGGTGRSVGGSTSSSGASSFSSAVKTPSFGGVAGGQGAYRGFSGSANLTPDQSRGLPADAQKFSKGGGGTGTEKNPFFDAIMKAEGTQKYGDPYNTSLGYMKSPKPLTEMTMKEVLEWGEYVRQKQGVNSSAKGAFQIVNKTQIGVMKKLGIGMDEKFTPENQRRMAAQIAKEQGLGAWEGFKRNPDQRARAEQNMSERDNWRDPPPVVPKVHGTEVPQGAPITGDLSAPPGLFDTKKRRPAPVMTTGSGVVAPDSIGAGKKADFGSGITPARSSSESEKDVAPAKRFETRPDAPTKEGGGEVSQRDDSGEQQDTAMDKKRRRAIMMNNDAGTYMISHQDAMA